MADIATLGLRIDASGAITAIDDTGKSLISLGDKAEKVAKRAAVAFGALAAGGLALTLKNTIEQERAMTALEAKVRATGGAAGFTAGELQQMAGEMQKVSTFGDEVVMGAQAILLNFRNIKGDTFKSAQQAMVDLGAATGSLEGAAQTLGRALERPDQAARSLRAANILLSESQEQAIKSAMDLNDVAGAQQVILDAVNASVGGTAEAMKNTLGGALMSVKNAFGDLFEVPGLVAPITAELNRLVDFLSAPSTIEGVAGFIRTSILLFTAFGSAVADVVGVIATSLGQLAGFFGRLSGPNSPLNKFARGMDSVAEGAARASIGLVNFGDRIAQAGPKADNTTAALGGLASAYTEVGTAAAAAAEDVKLADRNLFAERIALVKGWQDERIAAEVAAANAVGVEAQRAASEQKAALDEVAAFNARIAADMARDFAALESAATQAAERMADAFLGFFNRIAQRGKATFGDLFAGLSQLGIGGAAGGVVFGIGASVVDFITSARAKTRQALKLIEDQFDRLSDSFAAFGRSFGDAGTAFTRELQRIADFVRSATADIDGILTVTARRRLSGAGGDVDAAIASAEARLAVTGSDKDRIALEQLLRYRDSLAELAATTEAATAAAQAANAVFNQRAQDDLEVRRLLATGFDEEAEALRRRIANQKEYDDAVRAGADETTLALILLVQGLEETARAAAEAARQAEEQARAEAERARTIAGLDIAIARAGGNDAEATRIERELILAEVTDEVIRAKYEELWAIQDFNKAIQEAADAAELLARQQIRSEDLEVRRLIATGNAIEAEELRFQLEQEREIRRAEAELARGEITQEIFDKLIDVLGLEAAARAEAQALGPLATSTTGAGSAGGTQTLGALATAQVQDIDRVVGELTSIRLRAGQMVSLLQQLVRGGGILGAVSIGLQSETNQQQLFAGNVVVA
jgi:hypothetical protein